MEEKTAFSRDKRLRKRLSNDPIPMTGLLRLEQVLRLIPLSESTWWTGCREGRFPQPIHLSKRVTVWKASDIQRLIAGEDDLTTQTQASSLENKAASLEYTKAEGRAGQDPKAEIKKGREPGRVPGRAEVNPKS